MELLLFLAVTLCFVMSVNGDIDSNDNKKRHTNYIQEQLHQLHISDSEPEVKKRKAMDFENLRRGSHDDSVDEIPSHICGQGDLQFIGETQPEERCVAGHKVAVRPYTTNCGHTYCGEFIALLERLNISTFKCVGKDEDSPNDKCQEVVVVSNLKLDRAVDKSINKKVVLCKNSSRGCKEQVLFRKLHSHLENDCDFEDVPCPNCNRRVERGSLAEHQANCRSRACDFAAVGCENVSEPDDIASASSSSTHDHSPGVHLSLMYQVLASIRSASEFSASTLNSALTRHAQSVTCQEQALRMLEHPDEQKTEEMTIQELEKNYKVKRGEAQDALDAYSRLVHMEYPSRIAEPVQRLRKRGQWLETQEEEVSEAMEKFMKETNEAPILLNQGSMIFKLTNFSEKRMKAIKGELKRGVYGPLFYTHEFGYLMVPIVYPNGDGGGTGTHLSIFIAIKKGKFDPLLRWPVVGRVTISILSQRRVGRETVRHSFKTDVASLSYHRPSTDMNQASGIPRALDLNLLKQPSDFLVDDTLFIQIVVEPQLP